MTLFIATFALQIISIALMLGNYWYTFGLWPRSWFSFVGFAVAQIVVLAMTLLVREDGKK